ncbi:MAG: ribonuclease G [Candidatus Berkelbacteria bacterium]|nr:MAG: ribonuclease G [Candidatus Berkelbacteria bacterium]QQG52157.1 MAG: ribonuclease G [Candidatus Berkelbacteria bacterium]
MESTGGSGDVPEEIKGWNWGAFFLNWIWSIFNKVWIGLLALVLPFIPVVGGIGVLVMAIVLGLKGSEWAWKSRKFESVEQFKKVQKAWAIWGLVIFVIGIVIMVSTWSIVAGMLFGSGASLDY